MEYVLKLPTLQHLALVRIVSEVWNQEDVKSLIANLDLEETSSPPVQYFEIDNGRKKEFQKIEEKVVEKVMKLSSAALQVTETLTKLIVNFVRPLGLEILKWWDYNHAENWDSVASFPKQLCWTCHGTVDYKKTAEFIVKDEKVDVESRYKLACIYCLEEEIRVLWELLPKERQTEIKKAVESETKTRLEDYDEDYEEDPDEPDRSYRQDLTDLWTYTVSGAKLDKIKELMRRRNMQNHLPEQFAFKCAALSGNLSATEYCFSKLSSKGKFLEQEFLIEYVKQLLELHCYRFYNRNTDIVCFLLTRMNEEQQEKVFQTSFIRMMECFTDWPWQPLLVETAKRWWHFLDNAEQGYMLDHQFDILLSSVVDIIALGHKDYNYPEMFRKIWELSSVDQRKKYLTESEKSAFLNIVNLFQAKEEELVKLILLELNSEEIEQLIFAIESYDIPYSCIYRILVFLQKYDILKFLLDERLISEEMILKHKSIIKRHCPTQRQLIIELNSETFIQFVEDFIENKGIKRSLEDEAD